MKVNPIKGHVQLSCNVQRTFLLIMYKLHKVVSEQLLGITFCSKLKFEGHHSKVCNIVNKKRNALHRIANHMSPDFH